VLTAGPRSGITGSYVERLANHREHAELVGALETLPTAREPETSEHDLPVVRDQRPAVLGRSERHAIGHPGPVAQLTMSLEFERCELVKVS
jgi:hypothetical protein